MIVRNSIHNNMKDQEMFQSEFICRVFARTSCRDPAGGAADAASPGGLAKPRSRLSAERVSP